MNTWESGRESGLLDDIIAGRKTIEGRLNKGKFSDYVPGDKIWLRRDYRDESGALQDGEPRQALVEITAIRHYKSMIDMVQAEGYAQVIPSAASAREAAAEYDKYYSLDDQERYGVLAIQIAVVPHTKWDDWYSEGIDYGQIKDSMVTYFAGRIDEKPNRKALDIGCGTGRLTRQLKDNGFIVTGIDPAQIAIAKAVRLDNEIDYRVGEIDVVEGEVFDLIMCKLVYKFVDDKRDFLRRVKECLDNSGRFILMTPTLDRIISGKPGICVDRAQLLEEIEPFFIIENQQELPVGLMLELRLK